jgi:hypothetical protein
MSRRTPKSVVAASLLAIAGIFAATALAADVTSKIKVFDGPPAFHGKVKADKEKCVELRKVKVLKRKSSGNKVKEKDNTDMDGKWEAEINLKSGTYFAKVTESKVGNTTCLGDKSKNIVVD